MIQPAYKVASKLRRWYLKEFAKPMAPTAWYRSQRNTIYFVSREGVNESTVVPILTHEFLHCLLSQEIGRKASVAFDNVDVPVAVKFAISSPDADLEVR